ncbi:uncharacterized protein LTR77_001167 [Saxophila tyrrhenica]|uniref:Uncharacterized protein n=1 Tax=Saxophila tyrrhenica TaxID=1690608 RepID=A0AAV9PP80_9PEZI|nr:hypothetical protein LTR77_001167 [Saxophila tyrrhenica]
MPPKAAEGAKGENKSFSTEDMAALLAAMASDGSSAPGAKHYQIMNKIKNSKSASAWEHTFRPIKKRAKELGDQIKAGDFGDFATATPSKDSAAGGEKKKTPAKRGRKAKAEADDEESPTKKVKKEDSEADAEGEEDSV